MKFAARNTAAITRKLTCFKGKVNITFPAGTGGGTYEAKSRKVTPKFAKDGTVTVQAFSGIWKLEASTMFFPECRKDNGQPYRAFLYLTPVFSRWVS